MPIKQLIVSVCHMFHGNMIVCRLICAWSAHLMSNVSSKELLKVSKSIKRIVPSSGDKKQHQGNNEVNSVQKHKKEDPILLEETIWQISYKSTSIGNSARVQQILLEQEKSVRDHIGCPLHCTQCMAWLCPTLY